MPRIELYEGSKKVADIGLPEKKFSTGSVGYWATQKVEIDGKRYQCQFQIGRDRVQAEEGLIGSCLQRAAAGSRDRELCSYVFYNSG